MYRHVDNREQYCSESNNYNTTRLHKDPAYSMAWLGNEQCSEPSSLAVLHAANLEGQNLALLLLGQKTAKRLCDLSRRELNPGLERCYEGLALQ